MKKILIISLIVTALVTVTQAELIDSFVNLDFDDSTQENFPGGFDAPYDVPGWTDLNASVTDAGIEDVAWWNTYDQYSAFMHVDDGVYNLSSYTIQAGDQFTISLMAKSWDGSSECTATLFYDDPANVIGSFVTAVDGTWTAYSSSTTIAATAGSVGGKLGIIIDNSAPTHPAFLNFDEVTVARVPLMNNSPSDGATFIPIALTDAGNDLMFTVYDPNIVEVDVQFSTEDDPNLTDDPLSLGYKIVDGEAVGADGHGEVQMTVDLEGELTADLDYETTYYWKVIGYEPNYVDGATDLIGISGPVWTFSTVPEAPVINTQPADQSASPGDTVTFTVTATDPLGGGSMTYSWYYSADDVVDGTDSLLSSGTDANSLTFAADNDTATAVADQQGYYYCVVSNGNTTTTDLAYLQIKYAIAHYAFDSSDATDSSINANNGVYDPTVVTFNTTDPVIGFGSVIFPGYDVDPNSLIDLGTGASPNPQTMSDTGKGSASCWFKTSSTSVMSICGTFNDGGNTGFQINLNENAQGRIKLYLRGEGSTYSDTIELATDVPAVIDGQWHHVAFVWEDGAATEGAVYVDGVSSALSIGRVVKPTNDMVTYQYPMLVGARSNRANTDLYFVGEIDELKMYNYPLTKQDVWDQYLAGPADWVCDTDGTADLTYDFNNNCQVDLGDLAMLAADWLNSNRVYAP